MAPQQLPAILLAACATLLALAVPLLAGDPDMLQDFCVADYKSLDGPLRLNGFPCKRPENVTADDFFSSALALPGNTGNPVGSALFARTVCKGELFVFPRGLVHYQKNNGGAPAAAISAFNSQLPGTQSLALAVFAATRPVPTDVLATALHIDRGKVEANKSNFPQE
ncbi:hypothetical protein ZWY2020_026714 [Hordeum vulgare]|nr:hypothetical protein ZWY2020_026714 [Hordeum vulgare]